MSPSEVTVDFVSLYGAHGSPMESSPDAINCFFSSPMTCFGGRLGPEISPPGSLHFLRQIRGAVLGQWSSLPTSMPCFWAVSFSTCPPFLYGIWYLLTIAIQLMTSSSGKFSSSSMAELRSQVKLCSLGD